MIKLPEPEAFRLNYDGYGWDYRDNGSGSSWKVMGSAAPDKEFMYTESQMRQAIRDAYEEAAKVCEAQMQMINVNGQNGRYKECAEAIRNLKESV